MTSGSELKTSSSDGELITDIQIVKSPNQFDNSNITNNANNQESKLKRTFTLTRNALTGSMKNKRKAKQRGSRDNLSIKAPMGFQENDNMDNRKQNKKLFRRPSWNKFFNKLVQKVSTLSVQNNKNICSNYVYSNRRRYTMSLSSSDVRVPPTKPILIGNGDKVPGVMGLRNHGNTCFINAVLQCLSHTDMLAEYFVLDLYKVDLSRRNKLNSKKYGTKGEVTEQLALLLKAIWSCQYDPEMSNKFKLIVDKYGSQYRGNNQHDAQEFLLWLLDKVHEDLNTATKKKYKVIKVSLWRIPIFRIFQPSMQEYCVLYHNAEGTLGRAYLG